MKKLLLATMLLSGCVTTSTPAPKYAKGDCITLNASETAKMPPQEQQMIPLMEFKVVDIGSSYYVISSAMMGLVQGTSASTFETVEKSTNKVDCKK